MAVERFAVETLQVVSHSEGEFVDDVLVDRSSITSYINHLMAPAMPVTDIDTYIKDGQCRIYRKVVVGNSSHWITASGKDIVEATANLLDFPYRQLVSFNEDILGKAPTGHILRYALVNSGKLL